jgi:hypothetical protein
MRAHHPYFFALALALVLVLPMRGMAQAPSAKPLVTIRFNQPRVYFDKQLYAAVSQAVAIKPDVTFDVVSLAPATGNPQIDVQWQQVASHNTQAVLAVMRNIGVPLSRVRVTGRSQAGLAHDETQLFVR